MPDPERKAITPEAMDRLAAKLADWAEDEKRSPADKFAGKAFTNFKPGPRKFASFAHFPGTGPALTWCSGCDFIRKRKAGMRPVAICAKWKQMQPGGKATPIDHRSESCKYYVPRDGSVVDE